MNAANAYHTIRHVDNHACAARKTWPLRRRNCVDTHISTWKHVRPQHPNPHKYQRCKQRILTTVRSDPQLKRGSLGMYRGRIVARCCCGDLHARKERAAVNQKRVSGRVLSEARCAPTNISDARRNATRANRTVTIPDRARKFCNHLLCVKGASRTRSSYVQGSN